MARRTFQRSIRGSRYAGYHWQPQRGAHSPAAPPQKEAMPMPTPDEAPQVPEIDYRQLLDEVGAAL